MKLLKKVRERRLLTWLISTVIGYHLDSALFHYSNHGNYLLYDWKKETSRKNP